MGIVELISLLMGISGFSVGTNPNAPTPQAALEYAMPDADVIAYADVGALVPGNYKVLTNLANQPAIKGNPDLAKEVKKLIAEVDGPRGLVKGMTGVDLANDISDVTASLRIQAKGDPDLVVAVHGKFTAATLEKVAKVAGKQTSKVGSATLLDSGDGMGAALTKNGVLVLGTISLVKERAADTWKAPALTAGTNLGNASDVLGGKPVLAVVVNMSPSARKMALEDNKGTNFLTDLVKRHKLIAFSVHKDGIGWQWIDSTKAGLDSMAQISEGGVDILRAAHIAPRGFAKIVLGALDSYKGTNRNVDDLIKRKGDIWKIVESYSGDGNFKSQIDKDTKSLKLSVRLTGKSLSEVVPLGGLLPLGAVFMMVGKSVESPPSARMEPSPSMKATPPPAPPAKKQGNAPKHP